MEALLSKRPRTGEKRKPPPPLPHWTPAMVGKVVGQRLAAKSGRVQKLFRAADKDHSGSLSHDEFRRLLDGLNIQVRRIASRSRLALRLANVVSCDALMCPLLSGR